MSRIVILGSSVAGLLSAMQLARAGHDVTVIEREPRAAVAPPGGTLPAPRAGAPHAVQTHMLLGRAAAEIRQALPDVYAGLLAAGVVEFDLVEHMPASIADRARRAGDADLVALQTRRHTLDRVLVEAAEATPGLDLRFGVAPVGLQLVDDGRTPPRVTGVEVAGGERLVADIVIDASGRRTRVPSWLAAFGVTLPSESWECGLVYFTRHYRIRPGIAPPPLNQIASARAMLPSLVILWVPADNGTAMLAEAVLTEDALLKRVHRADCFEAVARAVPAIEPWLSCADPMTEVFGMGALRNTLRRVVRDGRPLVRGLHLVGDAACTTNPTLARGLSLAAAGAR
ncbi:MAG: FAD-dependent monooxygenase, partial [Thermomicrobiaceae bacterium]|nr:FAD-dependent monooxygenase [Thermomicrobiaceae bacterium]